MTDPLSAFAAAVSSANIPCTSASFRVTCKIERFRPDGDHQDNGWYVLYNLTHAVVGAFGDWKRGVTQKFCSSDRSTLTPQQWNEVSKAWKDAEQARLAEIVRAQAEAREKCKAIFAKPAATSHPYLTLKGVKAHGRIVLSDLTAYPGWLAVPLSDDKGIHSAQLIAEDGAKRFMFGGRVAGCWFTLNAAPDGPLVIAEGYATGASVHEATGWATVCAMNAGNLTAVTAAQRKLFPQRTLLIAADNDQFTEGNPGLAKARDAAKASNATVIYPVFADEALETHPTDFNDLQKLCGLPETKRQLLEGAKTGGDWEMLVEDVCDTMTEVIPEPVEIVEGLATEGSKVVVGGGSKTYKTWWMIDMALSISAGCKFIGRQCLRRRVLYINFELKKNSFKRRLQTICNAKGIHPDYRQLHHLSLRGLIARVAPSIIVDRIVALARSLRCEVVMVDPLYKLNTQGKDENAAGDVGVLLNELDRIITETNSTLFFADHFGKGNQSEKDPLDSIRGSSAKGGDVDAAIILRAHKEKGSFSVDVVHRELPPVDPFVVTWQYPLFHVADDLDAADMKRPKTGRPRLMDPVVLLNAFRGTTAIAGLSISALSRKVGMARQTLQGYMTILRAKGWVATSGEGSNAFQYITSEGITHLDNAENESHSSEQHG